MPVCLLEGTKVVVIAAHAFTLAWTHTVEKTGWEEDWRLQPDDNVLVLETARIKGSGAGMEPPDDARLVGGWWQYHPKDRRLEELRLANFGGAAGAWRICADGACRELPSTTGSAAEYLIQPCASDK